MTALSASFEVVTAVSASSDVVTALAASFEVVTAASAIFAVFTAPSLIFFVVTAFGFDVLGADGGLVHGQSRAAERDEQREQRDRVR